MDKRERRKSQRFRIQQQVTIKYNREGNFEFTGISRDLSDHGVFLHTESVIEKGAEVELTLTFPAESALSVPMQLRGRVIRVEGFPSPGIAVEFDTMTVVPEVRRQ